METLGNKKRAKMSKNEEHYYRCESCHYKCSKKFNLERHKLSSKHKKETNGNILETNNEQNEQNEQNNSCEVCKKEFKSRSGLWKHNKICNSKILENENENENENTDKEFIIMLIKENAEVKSIVLEQQNMMKEQQNMMKEQQNIIMKVIENGTYNINNTNNSHNKTFNLQFFLNETCKDAMNIMDFVDSIKLQLSDLENVGKLGYVEGISNIITTNLKAMDISQRPIHCTDKKRETLYIKDENKWEKEDEEKKKIKTVIKKVANKNIKLLQKFKEVHPDCGKSTSKFSDQYNKIIIEAMGGSGNNDLEKEEKIIQKISKNVIIDK
jgi:hypothetical protein